MGDTAVNPEKVIVEIDLAGLYEDTHGTFGDLIVAKAATMLLDRERDADAEFQRRMRAVTTEEIRKAVRPVIAGAILDSFQPTDTYGQPRGPKITLREAIIKEVQTQTGRRVGHGMSGNRTVLEEIVQVEVERQLRGELQEAVAAAKDEVLDAVRAQAADVITETIRRTAKV